MSVDSPSPAASVAPMLVRRPVLDGRLRTVGYRLTTPSGATLLPTPADVAALAGHHPAFVRAALAHLSEPLPVDLPGERLVLEVDAAELPAGETVRPSAGRRVVISVDIPTLSQSGVVSRLGDLRTPGIQLLASDVETADQFEVLRQSGFALFVGAFYIRPGNGRVAELPAASSTAFSTLAKLQEHGADLDRLADVVRQDPGLTLRLIAYANSAAVGLRHPVGSVRDALLMLGTRNVRQWATALVLAGLEHRPHALLATALVRARCCELLTAGFDTELSERAFTVGLLSLLGAIMETTQEQAMAELPLADDILEAVLYSIGPAGRTLARVIAFESGDLGHPELRGAAGEAVGAAYRDAVAWTDALMAR